MHATIKMTCNIKEPFRTIFKLEQIFPAFAVHVIFLEFWSHLRPRLHYNATANIPLKIYYVQGRRKHQRIVGGGHRFPWALLDHEKGM